MSSDLSPYYQRKIRLLARALFFSGTFNVGILAILYYWAVREPTVPFYELRPATKEQQQPSWADQRRSVDVIGALYKLPFEELLGKLQDKSLIEDGFTVRDLALSILVAFHHFDLGRALPQPPTQKRFLKWKPPNTNEWVLLMVCPGLNEQQFGSICAFARTEKWPMDPEGHFLLLQQQSKAQNIDPSLAEAFILTPEFLTVELLFKRTEAGISKQKILEMLLEGNWSSLKQFVDQQRQINDLSRTRRQRLLLDYIKVRSETAADLLIKLEKELAVKKLDDAQVITLLQLLPHKSPESEAFALELLTSPRSSSVWQQASLRLYEYAGGPVPSDWNYKNSLERFAPGKIINANVEERTSDPNKHKPPPTTNEVTVSKTGTTKKKISPVSEKRYRLYIVQEGDSLWKISRRFNVDMEQLVAHNELRSSAIRPGTVLKIP